MTTVRKFAVGIATAALVAGVAAPAFADPVNNRLAGDTRYDTAIAVAKDKAEFPTAGRNTVYVANGEDAHLIDAITAGTLAKGNNPLLLVNGDEKVQAKVKQAIIDLGFSHIVIIGGEASISKETAAAITPTGGVVVKRIAGETRYETAAKVADEWLSAHDMTKGSSTGKIYLANGTDAHLVDALVGGQLTAGPILLTDGSGKLPKETAKTLNSKFADTPLSVLGGKDAVSEAEAIAGNIAKVILTDSFVDDFDAAIKASAEADLAVNGYYTISDTASGGKVGVLGNITVANQTGVSGDAAAKKQQADNDYAKASATYPKIDATIVNRYTGLKNGTYFVPTSGVTGEVLNKNQVVTIDQAPLYYAPTLADGTTKPLNYAGANDAALTVARAMYAKATNLKKDNNSDGVEWDALDNHLTFGGASGALNGGDWYDTRDSSSDTLFDADFAKLNVALNSTNSSDWTGDLGKDQIDLVTSMLPKNTLRNADGSLFKVDSTSDTGITSTLTDFFKATVGNDVVANTIDGAGYKAGSDSGVTSVNTLAKAFVAYLKKIANNAINVYNKANAVDLTAAAKKQADAQEVLDSMLTKRPVSSTYERLGGDTRFETAVAINKAAYANYSGISRVYFANGYRFADAAISGMLGLGPVVLVNKDSVPAATHNYLADVQKNISVARSNFVAIGGTAVITDENLTAELDKLNTTYSNPTTVTYTGPQVTYANNGTIATSNDKATVKFTATASNVVGTVSAEVQYYDTAAGEWKKLSAVSNATWNGISNVTIENGIANAVSTNGTQYSFDIYSSNTSTTDLKTVQIRVYTKVTTGDNNKVAKEIISPSVDVKIAKS